jgi:predicted Fe-Mo cluster-binding NifX family protein
MCSKINANNSLIFVIYFCILHLVSRKHTILNDNRYIMKIAITTIGTDLNTEVDPRFGRAQKFLLVDSDSGEFTVVDNEQNLDAVGGAGIQSSETIARHGAEVLLTGHCGPNAFRALAAAGIKVVIGVKGVARDAIEKFKNGEYTFTESADVDGHW